MAVCAEITVRVGSGGEAGAFSLTAERLLIGREEGDIRIDDLLVSRRHAEIVRDSEDHLVLRDLESANGTFLNAGLLVEPTRLADGDDIRVGPAHLTVRLRRP